MVGPHVGPTTKASASKTCRENKPRARRAPRCRILLFGTPIAFGGRQFCVAMAAISDCFVICDLWPEINRPAWRPGRRAQRPRRGSRSRLTGSPTFPHMLVAGLHYSHLHLHLHSPCSANKALCRPCTTHSYVCTYVVHIQCSLCFSERMCQRSALLLQLFLLAHVAIGKADAVSALDDAEALDVMGGCRCCH